MAARCDGDASVWPDARASAPEVSSEQLGQGVLERLREIDEVSYLRFASVYKGFNEAEDFEREAVELAKTPDPE